MSTFRTLCMAIGFTTLGATATLTAGAIAGAHRGGGPASHGAMKFAHAMASLDLTEAQREMLSDLREDARTAARAAKDGGDETSLFADAIENGKPIDRQAVHTAIDEAAARRTTVAHTVADGLLDLYASLDKDQKAQLSEMVREHHEAAEQRRENLGERPAPRD